MVPLEPAGPLRPLSAFLYKLVVLVTVSRLWLGITLSDFLGDQWSAAGPPKWTPVGFGGKAGQALGWPICHEIMPKRRSVSPSGSGLESWALPRLAHI